MAGRGGAEAADGLPGAVSIGLGEATFYRVMFWVQCDGLERWGGGEHSVHRSEFRGDAAESEYAARGSLWQHDPLSE
jgi:hypothetical protein